MIKMYDISFIPSLYTQLQFMRVAPPVLWQPVQIMILKVIYHPYYSMNNFVINKSKLPQDGAQVFTYMG